LSGEPIERESGAVLAIAPGIRGRHASIEERRRLVAESLQVGNPGNRAKDLPEQADPRHDCQIEVRVEDIRHYEHNPRRANNAKFADIKESIRSTGVRNPLTVTRRPGERHFIIEAGGNTRLLAVQQLWAETRDPRFEKLSVLFRPWRSEGHVLVAHLIENEQRGDMTFWDKANGCIALKSQFEEEKGRALSLRQLEEELKAAGFAVNTATLAHYVYATARLAILGDAIPALSHQDVKTIQPRLNLLKRYAQMRGAMDEATLYAEIFEPVFRRDADRYREAGTFNASDLCQACEEALARHLGEDPARFRMILDALAQSPQVASLDSLLATGPAQDDAPGVNGVNSAAERAGQEKAPYASTQDARNRSVDPSSLDQLRTSVGRFAQLAVREGTGGPARALLALVSMQLDESIGVQLPEAADLKERDSQGHVVLDTEFFDWLLDAQDEAAAAFWDVATLLRRNRSIAALRPLSAEHSSSSGRR